MTDSASAALRLFDLSGEISPLGRGHIHDTYLVEGTDGSKHVLQRLNEAVFKDGDLVMRQTHRVLDCWRGQDDYLVPELVSSRDGESSVRVDGQLWRVWRYLHDTQVIDPIRDPNQVHQVAVAFASFQKRMRQLNGPRLHNTIEGFLDLNHYLRAYETVRTSAPAALQTQVRRIVPLASLLGEPGCTIHGDCKVNNVLFNADGSQVVAVIDFDTVMFGHWAWDFGDLVRSVCFSAGDYDRKLYAACVRGFVSQVSGTVDEFVNAPAYVAAMLGVRFLTDHLQGDRYFKVQHRGENLIRAEQQFDLLAQFLSAAQEMRQVVLDALKAAPA